MEEITEIIYKNIKTNKQIEGLVKEVIKKCFEIERLDKTDLYISITLSDEEYIHKINKQYRDIDSSTDVLSFPMFEKEEIPYKSNGIQEILGDIIICVPIVERQAIEYEHSFKRELAYMLVHGFYHLMGYDHIKKEDKNIMRQKEEEVLKILEING